MGGPAEEVRPHQSVCGQCGGDLGDVPVATGTGGVPQLMANVDERSHHVVPDLHVEGVDVGHQDILRPAGTGPPNLEGIDDAVVVAVAHIELRGHGGLPRCELHSQPGELEVRVRGFRVGVPAQEQIGLCGQPILLGQPVEPRSRSERQVAEAVPRVANRITRIQAVFGVVQILLGTEEAQFPRAGTAAVSRVAAKSKSFQKSDRGKPGGGVGGERSSVS